MHTRKDKATEREGKVSERTRASKRASMRTNTRRKMEREKDAYRKGLSVTLTLELSVIYELSAELYMNSLPYRARQIFTPTRILMQDENKQPALRGSSVTIFL